MATTTVNIPLTTLNNSNFTGQTAIGGTISQASIVVNRNVGALPMNADPTVVLALQLFLSWDGGTTFIPIGAGFAFLGGSIIGEDGNVELTSFLIVSNLSVLQANPTHAKAIVTATGQFSVSGTITLN